MGGNLPFPYDHVYDPSTIDQNLPNSNRVMVNVHIPPMLQQHSAWVIGMFRAAAQKRLNYGPLHVFEYNLLSYNHFQNEIFAMQIQVLFDTIDFMVQIQQEPYQQAIERAIDKVYAGHMAVTAVEYQQVLWPMLDAQTQQSVHTSHQEYMSLLQYLDDYRQGRIQPQNTAPPMGGGQVPPPRPGGPMGPQAGSQRGYNVSGGHGGPTPGGGHQNPPQRRMQGSMGVGGQAQTHTAPQSTPSPGGSTGTGGRYAHVARPTESWTTDNAPAAPTAPPQPSPSMEAPPMNEEPMVDLSAVVLDIKNAQVADVERPWDGFYTPEGYWVEPRFLAEAKRTFDFEKPYAQAYNPQTQMAFLISGQGRVEEKVIDQTQSMLYLNHELNAQLRVVAERRERGKNGLVVPDMRNVIDYDKEHQAASQVQESLQKGDIQQARDPVILDTLYTGISDLENEEAARDDLAELLDANEDDLLPPHQYQTAKVYPIHVIGDVAENTLRCLTQAESLVHLATAMRQAGVDETLNTRYLRFLDERLARAVNSMFTDNLSMPNFSLESFMEDIEDLLAIVEKRHGRDLVDVIESRTPTFLARWLNFDTETITEGETTREQFCLKDLFSNYQVAFELNELAALTLGSEAEVVNREVNPNLHALIRRFLESQSEMKGKTLRIITADGVYLRVLQGWLQKGSLLLKRESV